VSIEQLILEISDDPQRNIDNLEEARRVLHDIGEMFSSPGWKWFRSEIEELCQIDPEELASKGKEMAWETLVERRAIRKVLDLEQGFIETKAFILDQYKEQERRLKGTQDAPPKENEASNYDGFDYRDEFGSAGY
jgi:hypothetical protein